MKPNMGNTDRFVRIVLAAVIIWLYFEKHISGWFGLTLLIVAGIFVISSFARFCPLYKPLRIDTKGRHKNPGGAHL